MDCCVGEKYGGWCSNVEIQVMHHSKPYCIFHAPAECREKLDKWEDELVFQRINRAKSDDSICDLSGTVFPKLFFFTVFNKENPLPEILFNHATFCGDTYFRKVAFKKVSFIEVLFEKAADFHGASFEQVNFINSSFKDNTIFSKTIFNANATFSNTSFFSEVTFSNALFKVETSFKNVKFKNAAYFMKTIFNAAANFAQTSFVEAKFKKSFFGGAAKFSNTTFNAVANFREAIFLEYANFNEASFNSTADFSDADFRAHAIFSFVHFAESYFEATVFSHVEFSNTNFDKIVFFRHTVFSGGGFSGCYVNKHLEFDRADIKGLSLLDAPIESFRFISCVWPKSSTRNVVFDARLVDGQGYFKINKMVKVLPFKKLDDVPTPSHLGDLFRRLKKNAKNENDEMMASDWHYNEKEMQRSCLSKPDREVKLLGLVTNFLMLQLLTGYRIFNGYGEAPLRALLCLLFLILLPCSAELPTQPYLIFPGKMIYYLPLVKTSAGELKDFSTIARVGMIGWQLFITVQAALFGFALRNKFRR